jgi:hypothetical protein
MNGYLFKGVIYNIDPIINMWRKWHIVQYVIPYNCDVQSFESVDILNMFTTIEKIFLLRAYFLSFVLFLKFWTPTYRYGNQKYYSIFMHWFLVHPLPCYL